jgi:hypothetical protein
MFSKELPRSEIKSEKNNSNLFKTNILDRPFSSTLQNNFDSNITLKNPKKSREIVKKIRN